MTQIEFESNLAPITFDADPAVSIWTEAYKSLKDTAITLGRLVTGQEQE